MIQDYEQYITESRTNPTFISKQVKDWTMEILNEMHANARLEDFQTIKKSIVLGLQRGMHEYEKVFPDDKEILDEMKDTIQKLS